LNRLGGERRESVRELNPMDRCLSLLQRFHRGEKLVVVQFELPERKARETGAMQRR